MCTARMTPIVIAFLGHDNSTFSYLRYVFNKFYQLESTSVWRSAAIRITYEEIVGS